MFFMELVIRNLFIVKPPNFGQDREIMSDVHAPSQQPGSLGSPCSGTA
jgi:hypothetical protein